LTRETIIGAIQRGLKRGPLPPDQRAMLAARTAARPRQLIPARGQLAPADRLDAFIAHLEREYGSADVLASLDDVPAAAARYLAAQNLPASLVVSPHPELQALDFAAVPLLDIRFGTASPTDLASLSHAFAGIAETGTLLMPSGPTRPTLNNLLPDHAIVVLHENAIAGCFEDAFDRLRDAGPQPRNVMLVTGPSRSADIEQTLELGAHGPRRVHVLIIHGES
jgi:L-lactate dehydrogenase complex protein LldG